MVDGNLSRDDLFLLLQSYENTVKSNELLLNQQRQLSDDHKSLINKQAESLEIINNILRKLEGISSNICDHADACKEKGKEIKEQVDVSQVINVARVIDEKATSIQNSLQQRNLYQVHRN